MQLDTEPSIVIVILNELTVFTTSSETHLKSVTSDLQQQKKNIKNMDILFIPELKTLEWDILNPDRIINLEIKNERRTSNI